jgi:spermidine synthase
MPMLDDEAPRARACYLDVFAVALAAIVLEISYTRIFSFKLYYYFTYLVIGLALLGLGTGGVLVAIVPRLRALPLWRLVAVCCILGSLVVAGGYVVIATTQLNAFYLTLQWREPVKLLILSLALFAPFLAVGVVLAAIFGAYPDEIDRLYCADLLGAGLGCAAAVPLISTLTPPGCVMLAGTLLAGAGVHAARRQSRLLVCLAAAMGVVCLAALVGHRALPEPVTDSVKTLAHVRMVGSPVPFSGWSSVFRVDVTTNPIPGATSYIINHDGNWGSVLHQFNGDVATLGRFDADPRSFPFRVARPQPEVLIIGAAGGHEILASLHFDVRHVTGVELNPVTYSLLTTHFADYSGHLAENPRVTLVNAEGRSYLKRNDDRYDLVWFVAPDSYAAMNAATSGAFVLSESYLYTVEMITDTLDHLNDDGVMCAQFGEFDYEAKPNRTARYVATAREALRRRGIADAGSHIAVITTPGALYLSTVLVKKSPFTPAELARLRETAHAVGESALRFPSDAARDLAAPVSQVLRLPQEQLPAWFAAHGYDLSPVFDDSPFFWHFARFRDALLPESMRQAKGVRMDIDLTGERVLVLLLGFSAVFAAAWLLLPFVAIRRQWRAIPHKAAAAGYFAALGMGFMFFEVSMIQRLTLFLGYPSYSLSVTLFGMLVFGGIGSFLSGRSHGGRTPVLVGLLTTMALLTVVYRFGIPILVDRFVGVALPLRSALAALVIAPLGLTLGAFMPIGLRTVAAATEYPREFVAWAWAVNGFLSVIGSMLSTILAMTLGFETLMLVAVAVYAAGVASLSRIPVAAATDQRRA